MESVKDNTICESYAILCLKDMESVTDNTDRESYVIRCLRDIDNEIQYKQWKLLVCDSGSNCDTDGNGKFCCGTPDS